MQFKTVAALVLSAVSVSAVAIPEADEAAAPKWSFSIYQGKGCTEGPPANMSGSDSERCYPALEYYLASVMVHSDDGGNCKIAFYPQTNPQCKKGSVLAAAPGKIQVGECYTFPTVPYQFGIECSDS